MKINNKRKLSFLIVIGWFVISLGTYWIFRSNWLIIPLLIVSLIITKIVSHLNSSTDKESNQQKPKLVLNEKRIRELIEEAKPMLQSSEISSIKITKKKADQLGLKESKFGGSPFILSVEDYPKDNKGNYFYLLAQFNLSDLPLNEYFPRKGLLQFFVTCDESYGTYFGSHQVRYIAEASLTKEPMTDFNFLPEKEFFPFSGEYSLSFESTKELIPLSNNDLEKYLPQGLLNEVENRPDILEDYGLESQNALGHKLGGYGFFPQCDMRPEGNILLFQMDTDGDISWGDSGTAHFFIHPDDLRNLNFENVVYSWECF